MDLKDPKTQKLLLAGIGVFLIGYLWYAKIYTGYEQKIFARSQQYEKIRTELKNVEMKFRSLESLKEEYRDLTGRYRKVERLLPEAQDIPDLLSHIHAAALESNSRIQEVIPTGVAPEEFYNRDSYRVAMNTTYHDLGRFMAGMANFPFIVNVSDLELGKALAAGHAESMKKTDYTMMANFTLTTYYVQESERLVLFEM